MQAKSFALLASACAVVAVSAVAGATLESQHHHATPVHRAVAAAPAAPRHQAAKHRPAAKPAAPRPAQAGPAAPVSSYATDILSAGITAPVSWINSAGAQITADWRAGYTAAWTDANVLTPGGIYAYHLATFDQITARDFGVTPPASGVNVAPPAPAGNPQLTSSTAVVLQFYAYLDNQDYASAWALGGSNLNGGSGYGAWVAGYATTASISVTAYGTTGDGAVWTTISAVQSDGSVRTYSGTYTVTGGVITSADIAQTS